MINYKKKITFFMIQNVSNVMWKNLIWSLIYVHPYERDRTTEEFLELPGKPCIVETERWHLDIGG